MFVDNKMVETFALLQENLKNKKDNDLKSLPYNIVYEGKVIKLTSKLTEDQYKDVNKNEDINVKNIVSKYEILINNTPNISEEMKDIYKNSITEYFNLFNKKELFNAFMTLWITGKIDNKINKQMNFMAKQDNNQINKKDIDRMKKKINEENNQINLMAKKINEKEEELNNKMKRSAMQKQEIEYKKKLIDTRNRMLELSQEKNVYKNKVIYTLMAVVLLIIIILLAVYVYFQ